MSVTKSIYIFFNKTNNDIGKYTIKILKTSIINLNNKKIPVKEQATTAEAKIHFRIKAKSGRCNKLREHRELKIQIGDLFKETNLEKG